MKRVELKTFVDIDDDGNVVGCRIGTAPGYAPMYSVMHEGLGAYERCGTDLRHHLKMETYGAEFDRKTKGPVALEKAS